jgi:Dolichyl-phosphate-mannose-protein mannosyltransferase
MLSELQKSAVDWRLDVAIALLLTLGALVIRIHNVGFDSLSEDETAKWTAVQEYRQGHFVGVNAEHPMLLKALAWASLGIGERWNRLASSHGLPSMSPEGWLRFPNVILGSAIAAVLYLFCRQMMGIAGSFAASFFWVFAPLPIALNRLVKEETPLTFFTLLGCYFYLRAKQANEEIGTQRWLDLSAIGFGLSFGSQYILHLFGMNQLAWHLAGRAGLDRKRLAFGYKRFFLLIFLTLVLVDPVILSPSNFSSIVNWLHHGEIQHNGYDFDGTLYLNFPSRLLAGVPWYFYLWLLLVKTPVPIMGAIVLGSILLLRDHKTLASCFFLSFGILQLASLSICGAKWIRYSLPLLPFLFLAAGYAVQQTWNWLAKRKTSLAWVGMAAVVLFGWPLVELHAWTPYYPFYLNSIGGGASHITRYFAPDEVSEFDSREVAQQVCSTAPVSATLATSRPNSMTHYLERCGRSDIRIVPLYDPRYSPQQGDLIILEPSRRFFETQRFFDALDQSGMPNQEVRVGPVLASTIFQYDPSAAKRNRTRGGVVLPASRTQRPFFNSKTHNPNWASAQTFSGHSPRDSNHDTRITN